MQYGQALALQRIVAALTDMTLSWLERSGDTSRYSLPARLSEYARSRFDLSDREKVDAINKMLQDPNLEDHAREDLVNHRDELFAKQRDEITICVFDYLCGLRDLQTSILDERLFGNKSSLTLANSWLDV